MTAYARVSSSPLRNFVQWNHIPGNKPAWLLWLSVAHVHEDGLQSAATCVYTADHTADYLAFIATQPAGPRNSIEMSGHKLCMSGKTSTCFCSPQKESQGNQSLVLSHSCLHSSHNAPDDGQHWQPSLGTHPGYHKVGWHSKGSIPGKQNSCIGSQRVWL